jgi:hypothetical protein
MLHQLPNGATLNLGDDQSRAISESISTGYNTRRLRRIEYWD